MANTVIPPSPNWYCSKVTDCTSDGVFVFAARHDIYLFECLTKSLKLRGIFSGHTEKVTTLCVSPIEQYRSLCCSASEEGAVKVWDLGSQHVKGEHNMHSSKVTAVCWLSWKPDLVVTGDEKGHIGVWQFEENKQSLHRPDKGCVLCMAASPSNPSQVAVGYKAGGILIIDVCKGATIITKLRGHDEEVHSLVWCPVPGEKLGSERETADITDLETFGAGASWRQPVKKETNEQEIFGTSGWLLASGCKDRTIRVWGTSQGRQLQIIKLPNPGKRDRNEEGSRPRLWLTLCWSKPNQLISSSQSGDLLIWDITKTGKERQQQLHAPGRGHSRLVFNICPLACLGDYICTISMDRHILVWNLEDLSLTTVLPTLGGYVYAAQTSPLDMGRVALGVGDAMIRIWNLHSSSESMAMTSLWQGLRSKVTTLCWHPEKEGLLAYGTEDGRVGIYDVLSNKFPLISTSYHKRTVYVVTWGPFNGGESETSRLQVYSCGDGKLLVHDPKQLKEPAKSISQMLQTANPNYRYETRVPIRSEISWSPDYSLMAVGNDDGVVEIYQANTFHLLAVVHVHHKLVNCIRWHPHVTMATTQSVDVKHWIAIGTNETFISVVDLTNAVTGVADRSEPLMLSESIRKLEGHSNRVTCVAWSPHTDGHLVSASYDSKAIVWNVNTGSILACYSSHIGKLLCCQWHGLDPDQVITGADDFSVHVWNISQFPLQPGQLDAKKRRKKMNKDAVKATVSKESSLDESTIRPSEKKELEKLLEEKREQLLAAGAAEVDTLPVKEISESDNMADISTSAPVVENREIASSNTSQQAVQSGNKDLKKKRKAKSMFPLIGRMENRGKQFILDDLVTLTTLIYGEETQKSEVVGDVTHLGLFLNRRAVYQCLQAEGEHHRNNENMEYFYQLEIWKGNIDGVLRVARQRDELTDWLVAMAPMASYDTWSSVCEDYASQLESDGQYHKAATYFLACHKVYEAIKLFKRHRLFKEAIALAKVRLSPLDPVLEELYTLWAQQLTKDGNYEQAAKCHLAMKQVQDAAKLLARRYDQSSLKTAGHISMIANDKHQGLMYIQRVVNQHLVQHEWKEAYTFLKPQSDTQIFLATSSIHEILSSELAKLGLVSIEPERQPSWELKSTQKTHLPDFILDPCDVDALSPWQPVLIDSHTFPHHVLRTWYRHLDIAMDTRSLENMYKSLCLLHAGRQSQVELSQILIQVCTDLTLFLLSMLMSETPTAMSHLLHAVCSLQDAGHPHIMQAVLRLFLPLGPKYILKFQQEVTAMRVMISMDAHSHVDGASKVHTLKRYLSESKDDSTVCTSNLRCRELDCLRAYYYVAVLSFLNESWNNESGEKTSSSGVTEADVNKNVLDESDNVASVESDTTESQVVDVNGNIGQDEDIGIHITCTPSVPEASVGESDRTDLHQGGESSNDSETPSQSVENKVPNMEMADQKTPVTSPSMQFLSSKPKTTETTMSPCSVSLSQLTQLSQGVLWDVQAKRFALTETLGYIHKAISQLLLSKNSNSKSPDPNETGTSGSTTSLAEHPENSAQMAENEATNSNGIRNDSSIDMEMERKKDSDLSNLNKSDGEGAVAMGAEFSSSSGDSCSSGPTKVGLHECGHHHEEHDDGHVCHEMLTHHFQHMMNIHVPNLGDVSVPHSDSQTDMKTSLFDICSSCELLQKSRKILFEDEPFFHTRHESSGLKNTTSITNPAKYINVPDEWYSMPVDQKYFKPYVTMAILKDEQEYVMHELKRGPDSTQAPFPNPMTSIKCLLALVQTSSRVTDVERKEFVQKVINWVLNFAVTSQQKQTYISLLQSHLET